MIRFILIVLIIIGIMTGIICLGAGDYEYKIKVKPGCIRHQDACRGCGGRCEGADNMQDFVMNDCASCPYWHEKR